jgi:hypothetical protein
VGRDSVEPTISGKPFDGSAERRPTGQEPSDLTPGDHDVPPFNLGGQDMYAIWPDGQELAYTSNIDEVEATSTNNEIFIVPAAAGIVHVQRRERRRRTNGERLGRSVVQVGVIDFNRPRAN